MRIDNNHLLLKFLDVIYVFLQMDNYRAHDEEDDLWMMWILQILEGPRDESNLNDCLSGRYICTMFSCYCQFPRVLGLHMPLIWHYLWLGRTFIDLFPSAGDFRRPSPSLDTNAHRQVCCYGICQSDIEMFNFKDLVDFCTRTLFTYN